MGDIERQTDVRNQTPSQVTTITPDVRDRAGKGLFLCLESHRQGQYAVLVPCHRPQTERRLKRWSNMFIKPTPVYEEPEPWDNDHDSDRVVYEKLVDACYQHLGSWKRWLPYYGIIDVLETNVSFDTPCASKILILAVQFYFEGVVKPDGRYPIRINPVKIDDILVECERIIATRPHPDLQSDEICLDGYHGDRCPLCPRLAGEWQSQSCIKDDADQAEKRRHRLRFLTTLRDCARDPAEANGRYTLEGLAQESCIYDIKYVHCHFCYSSSLLSPLISTRE